MNFAAELAVDFLQPELLQAVDDFSTAQQAYGVYGVDVTFGFALQAQFPSEHYAITQADPLDMFNLSPALPNDKQHDIEPVDNFQPVLIAPTSPMGPPAQPRKRKARTLHAEDWEPYKDRILELHVTQQLPLPEVAKKIEDECGFKANLRQYRARISQWGKDKNIKPREMQAIVRKHQRRKLVENKAPLVFEVRDSVVPLQKIERWMKRNDVVESSLYAPSPAASTPSAVGCYTISERGSPAMISIHSPAASVFSPGAVYHAAQSPQMPSPALSSVSSIVRLQGSVFAGQSPAIAYRSLPNLQSGSVHTSSGFGGQMDVDTRPRYRQEEEERLWAQISRAHTSSGTTSLESSNNLYSLGVLLLAQGRYKTAEEIIRRLVEKHESQRGDGDGDGDDRVDGLAALDLLSRVLERQGLFVTAERLSRRVLQEREKMLGPEHPDTLVSISNLGLVLDSQGKYNEAEVMLQRAPEGYEKVLGLEHPDTLASLNNLGSMLTRQGKYNEAEAMHQRALEGYEKVLGLERPETLTSVSNLGLVLSKQGKYNEAEVMHRRALEGFGKVLGLKHPDTLASLNNLGSVLSKQGRYNEAEVMHRRALEGYEKVLGPEHPDTFPSLSNLGVVLKSQGKYNEAEAMHRRALEGREKVLGLEHPDTLNSVSNLGSLLERQGKCYEAEAMHRRALVGHEKVLGLEHPDTLTSISILRSVLLRQGKYDEAETMN